jgi:hypothetical protein
MARFSHFGKKGNGRAPGRMVLKSFHQARICPFSPQAACPPERQQALDKN